MNTKRFDALIAVAAILIAASVAIAHTVRSRTIHAPSRAKSKGRTMVKKRGIQMGLVMVTLAAVATASVGVTLAFYSNRPAGQTDTFASGTVSLTNVVTGACATTNAAPGDSASCTLATSYAGTLSGYVAVDVYIATQLNATAGGSGATNLYNPASAANEAQITVSSTTPTVTYVVAGGTPTTFATQACSVLGPDGNSYSTFNTCYLLSNLLVSATALSSGTVTFTTGISLPAGQPNTYQGGSVDVILSVHAVQSKNNAINCTVGGTSPTAGAVCAPAGSFAWS